MGHILFIATLKHTILALVSSAMHALHTFAQNGVLIIISLYVCVFGWKDLFFFFVDQKGWVSRYARICRDAKKSMGEKILMGVMFKSKSVQFPRKG